MKRALLKLVATAATALLVATLAPASAAPSAPGSGAHAVATRTNPLPSKAQWKRDVRRTMAGSGRYLRAAVAAAPPGEMLAINLDIDNSMMATVYERGTSMRPTWKLVGKARRWGVAVLVNSARPTIHEDVARRYLRRGGYRGAHRIDAICLRNDGEAALHSKQRCRAQYIATGYRLVLNVGNNPTDFQGGGYDRAYRLPNYHHRLG